MEIKMKNKILYIALTLSLSVVSCSKDFIDLAPENQLNTKNYFKTEDEFNQALIGAYGALRGYAGTHGWLMGEMRSDNTTYEFFPQNRGVAVTNKENVDEFLDDALNAQTPGKYFAAYECITRSNLILDRIGEATFSAASKNAIEGEARFLRAFFYFDLVQFYGGVPLILHQVTNAEQAIIPRASTADVYAQIVSDLTAAIEKLPQTVIFPQTGRVTIGAAKTLLANVYMVQKKYAEAEVLLKAVTQLGYQVLPDYASVYLSANKNSRESVFEIQYKQGATEGQFSSFLYQFIPATANTTVITGFNTSLTNGAGGNFPTQDMIDAYAPGDKRLDASIAIIEGTNTANGDFVYGTVKSIVGYVTPPGKIAKPFIKKFRNAHTISGQTDDNWLVYRYPEVLLFLAESLNEQSRAPEALPYLNQVRTLQRTGLSPVIETNQTLLRDIIAKERRIELAFESKRWPDLLRTGKAIEVMTPHGAKMKLDSRVNPAAYNVTTNKLLFPIPQSEININRLLTQNPGYN
jgi:tetratricopeptide (TPR) repeat protein